MLFLNICSDIPVLHSIWCHF